MQYMYLFWKMSYEAIIRLLFVNIFYNSQKDEFPEQAIQQEKKKNFEILGQLKNAMRKVREQRVSAGFSFAACLFQRKSRVIVTARSASLVSSLVVQNFKLANYSKSNKCINTKLAHHDKMQLQDKGHKSERYSFGVMPLSNINF